MLMMCFRTTLICICNVDLQANEAYSPSLKKYSTRVHRCTNPVFGFQHHPLNFQQQESERVPYPLRYIYTDRNDQYYKKSRIFQIHRVSAMVPCICK